LKASGKRSTGSLAAARRDPAPTSRAIAGKRTFRGRAAMSADGTFETSRDVRSMVAIGGKADIAKR
jgi:hypothetical protein